MACCFDSSRVTDTNSILSRFYIRWCLNFVISLSPIFMSARGNTKCYLPFLVKMQWFSAMRNWSFEMEILVSTASCLIASLTFGSGNFEGVSSLVNNP